MIARVSEIASTAVALTFAAMVARIGVAWLASSKGSSEARGTDPMAPIAPLARARRAMSGGGGHGHNERVFEPAVIEPRLGGNRVNYRD
jgi:hypothetical protein